jgi:hypothetical protein
MGHRFYSGPSIQVKAMGDLFHWAWILTAQRMPFVVLMDRSGTKLIPQCILLQGDIH